MLAQIWDLADINKAGQLNRDEFAIAMYLIVQQRSNPGIPLPETLPPNLIPPSMRQQQRQLTGPGTPYPIPHPPRLSNTRPASTAQPSSPFDPTPQPPPPPKSAADDLLGLDSFTSSVAQQPQSGAGAGGASGSNPSDGLQSYDSGETSPTATPAAAHSPIPPSGLFGRPAPAFVPTSNFGQSIMPSSTGGSSHSSLLSRGFPQPPRQPPQDSVDDLLGDADPEVSKKLTAETTELANLSNEIGSLTKQTQELNVKRLSAETDLSSLTTQKQHIEAQLSQLRTAYQKEAAQVKCVEEQLTQSRAETAKLSHGYQILQAEFNQLQYKKQDLLTRLETDKRENEGLKERMNLLNAENRSLREELDRLEAQAKREHGMVAISRKQVEKSEQEREKLKNGIDDASRSNVTSPVPPGSPTQSQASNATNNHNPFHRKSPPPAPETSNFASNSPFAPTATQASNGNAPSMVDDVFGPTFSSTPPPQPVFPRPPLDSSSYAPSAPESGHGGRSTPPTSPPASSYHSSPKLSEALPPLAATGAQITSAFLPLPISRTDSVTSSVQVNPSTSATSVRDSQFSRPDTPTNMFGGGGSNAAESPAARERDAYGKSEDRRTSFSVKSDAGSEALGRPSFSPRNDSPFALVEKNTTGTTSGGDEQRPKSEKTDSFHNFSSIPGTFPASVDGGTPIQPMPTGESTMSNRSRRSNASRSAFNSSSDPFDMGGRDGGGVRSASSKDLDDAFGRFPKVVDPHHTGGSGISVTKFRADEEFPPIEEIRPDSDSDTDPGFEDNFTSPSPVQNTKLPGASAAPPTNAAGQALSFDDPREAQSSSAQPPSATSAQQSPPAYNNSNNNQNQAPPPPPPPSGGAVAGAGSQDKSPYSAEFGGLLPSRSDPMPTTPGGSSNPAVAFPSVPTTSAADDGFDESAFGDLAEAKEEADDKTDNELGPSSAFDDFNPVFDTPAAKNATNQAPGMAISDDDDFAKFTFNIDGPSQMAQTHGDGSTGMQPAKPPSPQDWDAIFANFGDQSSSTAAAVEAGSQPGKESVPAKANGTSDQSGTDPGEGGVSLSSPDPITSSAPVTTPSAAAVEGGGAKVAGGRDDDKVTKLTGMGFDRESSVKALEQHGWNLDRVSSP